MATSREVILKNIRQALGRCSAAADVTAAFAALTRQPESPVQPPLGANQVEAFSEAAQVSAAEVHDIGTLAALPQWIRQRAQDLNQQPPLVLSPQIAELSAQLPGFPVIEQVEQPDSWSPNSWGIVKACAGIAETGTVVSVSEDCPSALLFLVERLVLVLDKADIVAYQEDIWARLRQRFNGVLPRTVNLVTGPSRTADVEQIIQLGAHGPRWVDYVLFEE